MSFPKLICCAACLLVLTGCVQVSEQPQTKVSAASLQSAERDLRVAAIELDSRATKLKNGDLGLLVVIGNDGRVAEANVPVRATLLDENDAVLLDHTEYAAQVAVNDTAIVQFQGQVPDPLKPQYQLRVEIGAVPDELNLSNNVRVYDVSINN